MDDRLRQAKSVAARPRRLRISELARRANVSHATIQHYVRQGLLPAPAKTGRTMAYYDQECVGRIAIIKELQRRYLPLGVIRRLLEEQHATKGRARASAVTELQREFQKGLEPAERPLDPETVAAQLDISPEVLAELERLGVVSSRATGEYPPHDVAVLRALSKLAGAGLGERAGFQAKDVASYRDAIQGLVAVEVATFLKRAGHGDPAEVIRLGITAAACATDLIVALRQKIIAEAFALLPGRIE